MLKQRKKIKIFEILSNFALNRYHCMCDLQPIFILSLAVHKNIHIYLYKFTFREKKMIQRNGDDENHAIDTN